jgi:preprotein translocase subunit SecF
MTSHTAKGNRKTIDFLGVRVPVVIFAGLLTIAAIVLLVVRGLNFGLDFTGGTLVEIGYEEAVPLDTIRDALEQAGYERVSVVHYGTDTEVLVRMPETGDPKVGEKLVTVLEENVQQDLTLRRVEFVGPQVGEELRELGGIAMLLALLAVMGFVAMRYELKLAAGGVIALFHDVIVALGFFALFQWDFDLNVLAAILAIIGYSINDTIVVLDRMRENFRKLRKTEVVDIMNISITETLDRTLATSGITLAALLSLLLFGGETLRGFSLALIIGTVVGTFSSIYIASPIALWLNLTREDMIGLAREGAKNTQVDDRP